MDRDEIKTRLAALLQDLLDLDCVSLTDDMTAADVPGWDSLAHLKLTVIAEKEFGIRFAIDQLEAPPTVGGYVDLIKQMRDARG